MTEKASSIPDDEWEFRRCTHKKSRTGEWLSCRMCMAAWKRPLQEGEKDEEHEG